MRAQRGMFMCSPRHPTFSSQSQVSEEQNLLTALLWGPAQRGASSRAPRGSLGTYRRSSGKLSGLESERLVVGFTLCNREIVEVSVRWREKRAQDTRTEVGERRWSRKTNGGPGKPGTRVVSEDLREEQEFSTSRKKKVKRIKFTQRAVALTDGPLVLQ